jgi:hypothetical protein
LAGKKTPAPVNLKRLYLVSLAVTLTTGIICIASLLKTNHRLDDIGRTVDPGFSWIDKATLRLGEAQSAFHRSIISPPHTGEGTGKFENLESELGTSELRLTPLFFKDFRNGLFRLEKLSLLAAATRDNGEWEELQIIARDVDRLSGELFTLLQNERSRLDEHLAAQRDTASGTIRITGFLLALSLILSVLIALGLYFNWKRFERAVLGME